MHASAQRLQATHTSSRIKRAPVVGSTRSALTGHTYRHSAVGHCRHGSWWNWPRPGYCAWTAGSTCVLGLLKTRMRGRSDRPCCLWTCEQMTSHVKHPMHSVGSGKMTPFASEVDFGDAPAARLTPPMASNAMNAPTAAAPPFNTLRRVAPPSPPAAGVVPLLTIRTSSPPFASSAGDHHALDRGPDESESAERQHIRADAGRQ